MFGCEKLQLIVFILLCGSMVGILSLLCVCTVTDFSAAEKGSSVKLCVLVRLLSRHFFSHFGGHWSNIKGQGNQGQWYE